MHLLLCVAAMRVDCEQLPVDGAGVELAQLPAYDGGVVQFLQLPVYGVGQLAQQHHGQQFLHTISVSV